MTWEEEIAAITLRREAQLKLIKAQVKREQIIAWIVITAMTILLLVFLGTMIWLAITKTIDGFDNGTPKLQQRQR